MAVKLLLTALILPQVLLIAALIQTQNLLPHTPVVTQIPSAFKKSFICSGVHPLPLYKNLGSSAGQGAICVRRVQRVSETVYNFLVQARK